MAQNKSLSTQEVADILHVSKSTIYDLIRRGEIPAGNLMERKRGALRERPPAPVRVRHHAEVRKPLHTGAAERFRGGHRFDDPAVDMPDT